MEEWNQTNKTKETQTVNNSFYFIFYSKIDFWPISYVAKMLVTNMSMAKMLMTKVPKTD